jgi:hypothetical protein
LCFSIVVLFGWRSFNRRSFNLRGFGGLGLSRFLLGLFCFGSQLFGNLCSFGFLRLSFRGFCLLGSFLLLFGETILFTGNFAFLFFKPFGKFCLSLFCRKSAFFNPF